MAKEVYDFDEAFCEGDIAIEDVDWDAVERLKSLQEAALATPEDERPLVMLGLLAELHGDDLVVL
jgi:hypothetical protein